MEKAAGRESKMALSKKPTTGMKDILPKEMQIRDYVMSVIKDWYTMLSVSVII